MLDEQVRNELREVTYLQRETIIKYFYLEKSLRQIVKKRSERKDNKRKLSLGN